MTRILGLADPWPRLKGNPDVETEQMSHCLAHGLHIFISIQRLTAQGSRMAWDPFRGVLH